MRTENGKLRTENGKVLSLFLPLRQGESHAVGRGWIKTLNYPSLPSLRSSSHLSQGDKATENGTP